MHCGMEWCRNNLGLPVSWFTLCRNRRSAFRTGGKTAGENRSGFQIIEIMESSCLCSAPLPAAFNFVPTTRASSFTSCIARKGSKICRRSIAKSIFNLRAALQIAFWIFIVGRLFTNFQEIGISPGRFFTGTQQAKNPNGKAREFAGRSVRYDGQSRIRYV